MSKVKHSIEDQGIVSITPETPIQGHTKIYPKVDGYYRMNDQGIETRLDIQLPTGTINNQTLLWNATNNDYEPTLLTPTLVGLSNVPNIDATNPTNITQTSNYRFVTDSQVVNWNGKQDALGFTPYSATNPDNYISGINSTMVTIALGFTPEDIANKSTDIITDGLSNTKYPSVAAIKSYADGLLVGVLDDRGNWDASGNLFPSTGGRGIGGTPIKGDLYFISVPGTLGGLYCFEGYSVRALVDNPGQISTNWNILNMGIGFVPYNSSNPSNFIALTALSSGTGISYDDLTGIITNSAPDQIVAFTGGTNVTIGGTYPNFTISDSSLGGSIANTQVAFGNSLGQIEGNPNFIYNGTNLAISNGGLSVNDWFILSVGESFYTSIGHSTESFLLFNNNNSGQVFLNNSEGGGISLFNGSFGVGLNPSSVNSGLGFSTGYTSNYSSNGMYQYYSSDLSANVLEVNHTGVGNNKFAVNTNANSSTITAQGQGSLGATKIISLLDSTTSEVVSITDIGQLFLKDSIAINYSGYPSSTTPLVAKAFSGGSDRIAIL